MPAPFVMKRPDRLLSIKQLTGMGSIVFLATATLLINHGDRIYNSPMRLPPKAVISVTDPCVQPHLTLSQAIVWAVTSFRAGAQNPDGAKDNLQFNPVYSWHEPLPRKTQCI